MSPHSGQPFQTHGFQTSIDVARQQTYEVPSLAGHKRHPDQGPLESHKAPITKYPLATANNVGSSHRSIPSGFTRASGPPAKSRLVASEIRPVTASGDDGDGHQTVKAKADSSADCPDPRQMPHLFLGDPRYGLSSALVANFAALGVTSIYPWQASCLLEPGLLEGRRHLVYTAPTGGGKSLVADVLMLKRIIENPTRKAIIVLPYVALVQEKLKWLRRIVQDVEKKIDDADDLDVELKPYHLRWKKLQKSIRVTGFFGGSRTSASWADTDIAVCTIEKVGLLDIYRMIFCAKLCL